MEIWRNPPLFDLAINLAKCKQYHGEQLSSAGQKSVGHLVRPVEDKEWSLGIVLKGREIGMKGMFSISHSHAL